MLAPRIAWWNEFVGRRFASTRWLHPGCKLAQCASAVAIDNRTGSSTYFSTADWYSTNSGW